MKKFISIIVLFVFVFSMIPLQVSAEEELQTYTLKCIYSVEGKMNVMSVTGVCENNQFYVSPETIAILTGHSIIKTDSGLVFQSKNKYSAYTFNESDSTLSGMIYGSYEKMWKISSIKNSKQTLLSLEEILKALGAKVSFDVSYECPLSVMMPYTVFDAQYDYIYSNTDFMWSEVGMTQEKAYKKGKTSAIYSLYFVAAMAEQESRTISTNIKWAWQRKFQSGEIILNTGLMLGYRREPELDEDGHKIYSIDDTEAEIVRRIYREFLSGKTLTRICRDLEADGIKTKLGKDKWRWKSVRSILTNEKYTGNAILGKTYKPDVLSKQRKKNDAGQAPQYYVENTHPAIISMEMFKLAQRELQRRDETKANVTNNSRFTSKYPFSGLLVCGECGARLRRHVRTMGTGEKVASWGCTTRITQGREACQSSHHVREDVLEKTYTAAIRKITENSDEIYRTVEESTKLVLEPDNKEKLEGIEQQIIEVQEKALALHKTKAAGKLTEAEYDIKISEIKETMEALEAEQKQLQDTAIKYTEVKMWLENIKESISSETIGNADDAMLMKSLVDNIIIKATGIEIRCKCGVTIEQEYIK